MSKWKILCTKELQNHYTSEWHSVWFDGVLMNCQHVQYLLGRIPVEHFMLKAFGISIYLRIVILSQLSVPLQTHILLVVEVAATTQKASPLEDTGHRRLLL